MASLESHLVMTPMRNTLQHAATRCNTLNTLQHAAARCNTLQKTATRCNTLQHAATALRHV